jgi:hypothetical protein
MIKGGYILQPRIIQESDISVAPPSIREIWNYLLREANHKEIKYNGNTIKRGQLFRSYEDIREGTKWYIGWRKMMYNENSTKKAMKFLRDTQRITTKKELGGVLITICNYAYYQDKKNYEGTMEGTDERTIDEPLTNHPIPYTNKNDKKEKKEEEIPLPLFPKKLSAKERSYEYLPIAKRLSRIVQETKNITHEKQQIHSWANEIRKLVETNGVSVERINKGLDYLQKHSGEMYCPEIESGATLREKFTKIESAISRDKLPQQTFKCPSNWKFGVDYEEGKQGCRNCGEYHPNIHAACKLKIQSK